MDAGGDDIDEQLNASAAVAAARAAAVDDNDVVELPSTSDLSFSDVLDVIRNAAEQFPGAGAAVEADMARPVGAAGMLPNVEIKEQPAPKALRFRYECEGRSAGSIPGINSTNENKTYPTIRINNYVGDVTIVVSCVNKDQLPTGGYRPHPHNLVGRERCDKGVCTVKTKITAESCEVPFKNLGIQCIRKKDVEKHLLVRESLRVDPFRTGFDPRSNNSLDLNQVRLAFQVFVPGSQPNEWRPLKAVASDVIVDKKAMGELTIVRVGTVAGSARGGTQVIVLCEKVTKDETVVEFYEESSGWEVCVQPILVHKQYAIVFDTPPYRDPRTTAHANVKFRLRRINTGEKEKDVSNSSPFEYIPDETATGTARKPPPDLTALAALLAKEPVSSSTDAPSTDPPSTDPPSTAPSETHSTPTVDIDMVDPTEKSLNELLDQVAELDEIYSENRTRLENVTSGSVETDTEDFNDAGTYTSLQLAFRNPVDISEPEPEPYEDVQVHSFRGPIIEFTHLKSEDDAPPLPPKRVRKSSFKSSQTSVDSVIKPGKQIPVTRNPEVLKDGTLTGARSEPALPPVKKRSFFSRLFRKKGKSPAPSVASEGKKDKVKPVGRSVSSVSGIRPSKFKSSISHTSLKDNTSTAGLSYADSITHISLHGDDNDKTTSQNSLRRPASLHPIPPTDGGTILVAESVLALDADAFKKLQDDLELTDAEHYALYMSVAPHATVSEFDETSCYYSPIDGSKYQN